MASVIVVVSSGTVKIIIHDPQPVCKPLDEGFRAVFGIRAVGENPALQGRIGNAGEFAIGYFLRAGFVV